MGGGVALISLFPQEARLENLMALRCSVPWRAILIHGCHRNKSNDVPFECLWVPGTWVIYLAESSGQLDKADVFVPIYR